MERTEIGHKAIVTNLIGNQAVLELIGEEECHSCSMKGICGVDDPENGRFVVKNQEYEIGQFVNLQVTAQQGFLAVFWAYLLPFLLIVLTLALGHIASLNEGVLGLMSLLIISCYFVALYFFRKPVGASVKLNILTE